MQPFQRGAKNVLPDVLVQRARRYYGRVGSSTQATYPTLENRTLHQHRHTRPWITDRPCRRRSPLLTQAGQSRRGNDNVKCDDRTPVNKQPPITKKLQ